MKTLPSIVALIIGAALAQSPLCAMPAGLSFASSPDHPQTWADGASRIHQDLRWDAARQMLVADVKYSTVDYADSAHPTQVDDLTMAFPTVRFDSQSNRFTANGVVIGSLRPGLFGTDVVLSKNADLDIHRHDGRIFARIVPRENE
jgi:hypothetical protein